MDAILKQKWIDALRSGEYKQGFNKLMTEDGCYCCLGVLAKVNKMAIRKDGKGLEVSRDKCDIMDGYDKFDEMMGARKRGELVTLNDEWKKTFPEIATYIEQNL